ncbi:MAG TPA: zf-HC2 domain-containing protein [Acidobacteriota bacterium]|nr:zf-HC2 domain-containing protein [Acidobacteriota bacterium]
MADHCPQEQIAAWLDSQLAEAEAAQVELHLRQCADCRNLRDDLAATNRLFHDLEVLDPPDHLWTRIEAKLDQSSGHGLLAWIPRWEGWLLYRRELIGIAAGVLLLIGVISLVLEPQTSRRSMLDTIARIDSYHAAQISKYTEFYNPFRIAAWNNPDSNPFARPRLDANANPFGSLKEKR